MDDLDPDGELRTKRFPLEAAEAALASALQERREATFKMLFPLPQRRRSFERACDLVTMMQAVVDDEKRRLDAATVGAGVPR